MVNPNYLKNGASYLVRIGKNGYFKGLTSAKETKKVVKEAIMGINTHKIANSSSTILSQMEPYQGVSEHLDTKNWSSNLRFYHLHKSNSQYQDVTVNLNDYSANYGRVINNNNNENATRRVIVSTGKNKPEFLTGNTAFHRWLIRPSNESDKEINRRFIPN